MSDENIDRVVGQLEGKLDGIEKGLDEIKGLLKEQSQHCDICRGEIDTELNTLKTRHAGETAVDLWWNNKLAQGGILAGIVLGVIGFFRGVIP